MNHQELLKILLGCHWGHHVWTPEDVEPCEEGAVQVAVLHDGPKAWQVQLCQRHLDVILALTTPHGKACQHGEHDENACCCDAGPGPGVR